VLTFDPLGLIAIASRLSLRFATCPLPGLTTTACLRCFWTGRVLWRDIIGFDLDVGLWFDCGLPAAGMADIAPLPFIVGYPYNLSIMGGILSNRVL